MPAPFLLLVANERPLINIDISLALNLGVWLGLFFFLRAVLWEPLLALLAAREAGTEGARKTAARLDVEAKDLKQQLATRLTAARAEATSQRDALRADGSKREAEIAARVRDEVAAAVEKQRGEIAAQKQKLRAELAVTAPELASQIAGRVLRREVRS